MLSNCLSNEAEAKIGVIKSLTAMPGNGCSAGHQLRCPQQAPSSAVARVLILILPNAGPALAPPWAVCRAGNGVSDEREEVTNAARMEFAALAVFAFSSPKAVHFCYDGPTRCLPLPLNLLHRLRL
jgi:hypothetical protein